MTTWYLVLICTIILFVVGIPLRLLWTRQLHRRHGNRYSFWFIFRKLGRSPFGRWVLQPHEMLDPAFRNDLEQAQRRVFLWGAAMLAICFLVIFVGVVLSKKPGV